MKWLLILSIYHADLGTEPVKIVFPYETLTQCTNAKERGVVQRNPNAFRTASDYATVHAICTLDFPPTRN